MARTKKSTATNKAAGGKKTSREASQPERNKAALSEMSDRLSDMIAGDPIQSALRLMDLAVSTLASAHPPALTAADRQKIKANFSGATPELIAERAMSVEGLNYAIGMSIQIARIAIDYSPLSHIASTLARDEKVKDAGPAIERHVSAAFGEGVGAGLSPFGVACTTILLSVMKARSLGVHPAQIVRPLLDGMELAFSSGAPPTEAAQKEAEEAAMQFVMQQMGISRATAKKYLAHAKAQMAAESLSPAVKKRGRKA